MTSLSSRGISYSSSLTTTSTFEWDPQRLSVERMYHATRSRRARVLCVSIEASGDRILSETIRALKSHPHFSSGEYELIGVGGELSEAEGLESLINPRMLAAHGLTEALRVLPATLRAWSLIKREAPHVDAYLLVDAPELNLRLLRWVKTHIDPQVRARPVFYLAPPQAWAWRPHRVETLKYADLLGCLFPFTAKWYHDRGAHALYVGHPLVSSAIAQSACPSASPSSSLSSPRSERAPFEMYSDESRRSSGEHLNDKRRQVALFPGSRRSSVSRALPLMLSACVHAIHDGLGEVAHLTVSVAETAWISQGIYQRAYRRLGRSMETLGWSHIDQASWRSPSGISLEIKPTLMSTSREGQTHEALRSAQVAICYAGTSTLESAIAGVPPLTISPLSRFSALVARRLIKLSHCALPNLIMSKRAFPELAPWESDLDRVSAMIQTAIIGGDPRERYREELGLFQSDLKPLQSRLIAKRFVDALQGSVGRSKTE